MPLLWETEETMYDSFVALFNAIEENSINPTNVTVEIKEDCVIAYRPAPEYPENENTISKDGEQQWLVEENKDASYVLQELFSSYGLQSQHHKFE